MTTEGKHGIQTLVEDVHARHHNDASGEVATYIPELGNADPEHFGICLASVDGQIFEVGDTRVAFTIQSISKAFVFAMAMEEHGRDEVLRHVGVEPSGDAFNSIVLDEVTGRPTTPWSMRGPSRPPRSLAGPPQNPAPNTSDTHSVWPQGVSFSATRPCLNPSV